MKIILIFLVINLALADYDAESAIKKRTEHYKNACKKLNDPRR